jgi:hypothetical protein
MLGGTWMPELIAAAAGVPLGVAAGQRAPTLDLAALERLEPEVVVVKPCGYPVERTLAELELLPWVLPWTTWPAVRSGRVFVADGNAYSNRSGPQIVDLGRATGRLPAPATVRRPSGPLPGGGPPGRRQPRGMPLGVGSSQRPRQYPPQDETRMITCRLRGPASLVLMYRWRWWRRSRRPGAPGR